ncbi:MAG: hypothetical protein LBT56_00895 [Prevotellaceae bacterium]|nr:hypothetical protein [Prevotellaceae bacterium]
MKNEDTIFYERQRNVTTICWLLGVAFLIFSLIFGNKNTHNYFFENYYLSGVFVVAIPLLVIVFTYFVAIQTIINDDGIYVRMLPFQRKYKFFAWDEIEKIYIRKYRALSEYGGWGYNRRTFGFNLVQLKFLGKEYNKGLVSKKNNSITMSGNKGLQIEFTNGAKLLIGTHKSEELAEILKKLGKLAE